MRSYLFLSNLFQMKETLHSEVSNYTTVKQICKRMTDSKLSLCLGNIFSLSESMYCVANNSLWSDILQSIMSLQVLCKYYC